MRYLPFVTVIATVALCFIPKFWLYLRHFSTLTHEVGHAVVGMLTGGRLRGIALHPDSSGETTTAHVVGRNKISRVLTSFAGYPSPAIYGTALLITIASGYQNSAWIIMLSMSILCLVFARSFFTVIVGLSFAVAPFLFLFVAQEAPLVLQNSVAYAFIGVLLYGSVRSLVELTNLTHRGLDEGADSVSLQKYTGISRWFWLVMLWIGTVAGSPVVGWMVLQVVKRLQS